ncbi:BRO1-like domain-containing protein [Dichotomocladium elegans]|nr:BRO1-like domain-containing protein [Dichotomocladium elegans]
MAQLQIPLINVPSKRTADVDWVYPLKHYIAHVYQEDPEKYNEETYTLNRLRQDTRGAGKDITGRDLQYRYFGQLELLDLRFPVDEKNVKVLFNWYDAFNGRATAQYSLAYEKASVIFNIAATLSAIAAFQNRAETDGRKKSFHFFQAAAGMFQYINDNFLHAPSQDLSRETVKMLTDLMLVQAHECFLESSLREKKKDGLVAKLASHAVWAYGNLVDELQDATSRGAGIDKSWMTLCQIKNKYYQALAQQHKAAACEIESKYGEQVARLRSGESTAKEAIKLCSNLISQMQSSNNANGTLPADSGLVMQELSKSMAATCGEKYAAASRDNDMIYHDNVPQESILPPIDRLKTVKAVPLTELYSPNDIGKVIGPDIFAKLVPLSIHESASMYSEEKAKLLRGESERCDLAKAEFQAALEYMNLPASLDKFRKQQELSVDDFMVPTKDAQQWADEIAAEETSGHASIEELIKKLNGLRQDASEKLDKAALSLDEEMHACESMRVKFGEQWSQPPSSQVFTEFRCDIRNHRTAFENAAASDNEILRNYQEISREVSILRQGGKSKALDKAFSDATSAAAFGKPKQTALGNVDSLLDLDMSTDNTTTTSMPEEAVMAAKVEKVESALAKLRAIEEDRSETLNDLREKSLEDDISSILILNKKSNAEQQIFAAELEKYKPHQQRITLTIQQQQQAIRDVTEAYKSLMEDKEAMKLQSKFQELQQFQKRAEDNFKFARDQYISIKDALTKGIQFYSNASDMVESLYNNIQRFLREREQERDRLLRGLDNRKSPTKQETVREDMSSYASAPPLPAELPVNDSMGMLAEITRSMSLNEPKGTAGGYRHDIAGNQPYSTIPTMAASNYTPLPYGNKDQDSFHMYNPSYPIQSYCETQQQTCQQQQQQYQQRPPLPPKPLQQPNPTFNTQLSTSYQQGHYIPSSSHYVATLPSRYPQGTSTSLAPAGGLPPSSNCLYGNPQSQNQTCPPRMPLQPISGGLPHSQGYIPYQSSSVAGNQFNQQHQQHQQQQQPSQSYWQPGGSESLLD